ncbi:MAG TPA: VOC family protein [Blastocatellia bacterium]|nr:VOC family protein [Blastocatellia bacterium]
MSHFDQHAPGSFCWIELGTSDAEAAKKFYTQLFGWTANDTAAGPDMVYTILQLAGKDAGALFKLTAEHQAQGVPPHWLSYISVKSADESAEKAQQLGGKVVMSPFDVMDVGRMAMIQDPTGATFAIWQARNHIGVRVKDEPGALCWNELATTDKMKAAEFYTKLFGWRAKGDDPAYTEWMLGEVPIGGMMEIRPEWGPVPPNWMPYIQVSDCNATAENAMALGGSLKVQPTDIPHVGRFATIQDPQGAVFSIVKLDHPA